MLIAVARVQIKPTRKSEGKTHYFQVQELALGNTGAGVEVGFKHLEMGESHCLEGLTLAKGHRWESGGGNTQAPMHTLLCLQI